METRSGVTGAWGLEVFDHVYPGVSDFLLDPKQEKDPWAVYVFADCGGAEHPYSSDGWAIMRGVFAKRGFVRFSNEDWRTAWRTAWRGGKPVRGMEQYAHFFNGLDAMPNPADEPEQ